MLRTIRSVVVLVGICVVSGLVATGADLAEASYPGEPGRVAFVESPGAPNGYFSEIYTMNPDRSDRRRITFDGGTFVKRVTDGCASEGYLDY